MVENAPPLAIVIGIGALLALLAFTAWDRRRCASSPPVVGGITSNVARPNLRANGFAAVSLMAVVMALSEFLQRGFHHSPAVGRSCTNLHTQPAPLVSYFSGLF